MYHVLSSIYRISYKASVVRKWRSHIFQVIVVSGLSSSVFQVIGERAVDVTSSDTDIVSQVGWNRMFNYKQSVVFYPGCTTRVNLRIYPARRAC